MSDLERGASCMDVAEQQRVVQRKLGRCMLRLQQYELLLKNMVTGYELSGPPEQLQRLRDKKVAIASKKTMGALLGILTNSYMTQSGVKVDEASVNNDSDSYWISVRFQMELTSEEYEKTKATLNELLWLRNELVHHFLQRFDLWEFSGLEAADRYLDESYEVINCHYLTLQSWDQSMTEARALMASFIETQAFESALDGIMADGSVDWLSSRITTCLREAETQLAKDGWTALDAAIAWIRRAYPEQAPKRYGCSSWRHVIHESKQFEVRKQIQPENECTVVWYRSRQ